MLKLLDLIKISSQPNQYPILAPKSEYLETLTCEVCFNFTPYELVSHYLCRRLICAQCAINIIKSNLPKCAFCREDVFSQNAQDPNREPVGENDLLWGPDLSPDPNPETKFLKPSKLEAEVIERILYHCNECNKDFNKIEALTHPNVCSRGPERHIPPPHIPTQSQDEPIKLIELVSNPINIPGKYKRYRLCIIHNDGRQLVSKMFNRRLKGIDIKIEISNRIDRDVSSIRLFKFIHKEIDNDDIVDDFAPSEVATYLTSFTSFAELKNNSANLIFKNIGPPPHIDKPDEETW